MTLKLAPNPLLARDAKATTLYAGPVDPFVCNFKRYSAAETRYIKGKASAAEMIGTIEPGMCRLLITIGHTDLTHVLLNIAEQIGPCELVISTWDVAQAHLTLVREARNRGMFTRVRWILDCGFVKRDAPIYATVIKDFGKDSIREWRNHAKVLLLGNADRHVCVFTSANLGSNPRQEHYSIVEDGGVYEKLLREWIDPAFARPRKDDAQED